MADGNLSAGDIMALTDRGDFGGNSMWIFALLILVMASGGNLFGGNAANALGYENLATSNEVQRGFDNQNLQAQTRDILAAVNAGTAQSVATTNQVYHDIANVVQDKYAEIQRDTAALAVGQANILAQQQQCCCDTKMLIAETAAQNRYDNAMNTQKILDVMAQDKMAAMQNRINALELQNAVAGVVRYPMQTTYTSGNNPFCNCGAGCCNM